MKKKNLITLGLIILIVAIVGVALTRLQLGPGARLAFLNPFAPTPTIQSAWITQGDEFFQQGQMEAAFTAYSAAIKAGEELAKAHAGRGNIYTQWRRFREAEQDYSAALNIQRDPVVLANRCVVNRLLAKFDIALQDCQEAIQLDPEYIDAYVALSVLHLERGQADLAKETIETGLQIKSDNPNLHYALGQIEISQGRTEAGIAALDEAIRLDPNQPQFYWDRGFAYYSLAKLAEASQDMQMVIEKGNPDRDGELIYRAGSLLASLQGALNP